MEIIPAILPTSRADLESKLVKLAAIPAATFVQVDAVDGTFAAPACWPYASEETLPRLAAGNLRFDADLMVAHPEAEAERFARAGASRITLHAESAFNLAELLDALEHKLGRDPLAPGLLSVGLALSLETPLALIEPHLSRIDYVQLMGIAKIGRQHEPFDPRVLPRIETLHKAHPELPIQIDGGVSLTSAPLLLAAGASRLVVGSALWGGLDLAAQFEKFQMLSSK